MTFLDRIADVNAYTRRSVEAENYFVSVYALVTVRFSACPLSRLTAYTSARSTRGIYENDN